MAFSAVTERGSATEKISDTSIAVSPSANLAVDKIVMVLVGTDNAATTAGASTNHDTLADTDGNIWAKVYERTQSVGAAADGVTHSLWWTKVTTQIDTSDSITFTGDTAVTAKVIAVWEVTVGAGNTVQVAAGGTVFLEETATTNPAALVLSGLNSKEYFFVGVMTAEEETVPWTESSSDAFTNVFASEGISSGPAGGVATNVTVFAAYRIATATGTTFDVNYPGTTCDKALAVIAFEEVTVGGTGHTATQTDPEGLLDSAVQVTDSARPFTDLLGLLDSVGQVAASLRDQTDPLGLLDSVTYEQSGLTSQTVTDPLGLVDSATVAQDHIRSVTDLLGMVDSGEWIAVSADALGILDTVSVEQGFFQTVTDPLGLTDSVVSEISQTVSQTDPLGVVDAASAVTDSVRSQTDPLGLTDSVVQSAATLRDQTDPLGLLDDVTYDLTTGGLAHNVTVTDNLGIVDSMVQVAVYDTIIVDLLGLTDPVSQTFTGDITIGDLLGLVDSVDAIFSGEGFWTPDPAGYTANPAAYVPVGPTDTPPAW